MSAVKHIVHIVREKFLGSVQFKFIASFLALIAVLLLLLNTYPLITSRDAVFREKENALLNQAAVISSFLSERDSLTQNNVTQVMDLLDITGPDRIVVTDPDGVALYDTDENTATGYNAPFPEVYTALGGQQVFYSHFIGSAFESRAAIPVRAGALILGAVYIVETDYEQAELIVSIQGQLRTISLVACILVFALSVVFSRALTSRITQLVDAIRVVSGGDYAHRLALTGSDELTELGGEFNRLTERLETTEAQRRRFVSDASHELKTPLASIRLLSDSIVQSEGMDNDTMREFVTDIGSEAERLQRTTDKLLNLSRLDDGAEDERVTVNVGEVARATLRLLKPLADTRGISVTLDAAPGCAVLASEEEIYQIIFNLAENAIKYNTENGRVSISITREEAMVGLTVCDTGIGIPPEDRPHIFSRFYRVDKARSREAGGSGLGLSIVHDTVTGLGGTIEITAPEEGGSCFTVRLPLLAGDGAPGPLMDHSPGEAPV